MDFALSDKSLCSVLKPLGKLKREVAFAEPFLPYDHSHTGPYAALSETIR